MLCPVTVLLCPLHWQMPALCTWLAQQFLQWFGVVRGRFQARPGEQGAWLAPGTSQGNRGDFVLFCFVFSLSSQCSRNEYIYQCFFLPFPPTVVHYKSWCHAVPPPRCLLSIHEHTAGRPGLRFVGKSFMKIWNILSRDGNLLCVYITT